ncbi:hypothetical protein PCYB_021930 [Plasmodium cynomolgi strain B]|uniref:Uncharacterized protein n=1 Tax=Plasmodium cynomolgi (strain B) TaxID=1120755 RepID=K6UPP6_PLACD|nr:hypothetical protein PCYB_021930 [Plasmodium cynomolgi strain B]GAB64624.1 hypothetical protein PCYB_021930 [Plasmodium cynomolgi strain B]
MEFCEVDLDEFCYKQFDRTKKSCSYIPYDKNEFLDKVNELIRQKRIKVVPGYAGFCKHIFVENFTEATVETIEINNKNRDLIKTDYISRRDNELPVLIRWISKKDVKDILKAKYLDLILYSREQIEKENKETKTVPNRKSNCLYSIICIKPQNVDYELPMTPITMLRNTLISEGGSGINLNRDKYLESVKGCSLRGGSALRALLAPALVDEAHQIFGQLPLGDVLLYRFKEAQRVPEGFLRKHINELLSQFLRSGSSGGQSDFPNISQSGKIKIVNTVHQHSRGLP